MSRYCCRSIGVRGRWNTPKLLFFIAMGAEMRGQGWTKMVQSGQDDHFGQNDLYFFSGKSGPVQLKRPFEKGLSKDKFAHF